MTRMKLEQMAPSELEAQVERLATLRHDLGKYIAFEARFVGEDADTETLRAALRADLEATRRHGDEVEPAQSLWCRLRPQLDEPEVGAIDVTMAALGEIDLAGPDVELRRAAGLAREVSVATRSLHKRALACREEPNG
jgi:hypothetical protein